MSRTDDLAKGMLAWPQVWEDKKDRALFQTFVALGPGLLLAVAARALRHYEPAVSQLALYALIVCLLWVPCNYLALVAGRWRGYLAVSAVTMKSGRTLAFFPVSRPAQYARQLYQLTLAAFVVVLPVLVPRIDPSHAQPGLVIQLTVRFWPILLLFTTPWLLGIIVRGWRRMGVGLSEDGLYVCSWTGACFYRWDEISSMEPVYRGRQMMRWPWDRAAGLAIALTTLEGRRPPDRDESVLARFEWFRDWMSTVEVGHLGVDPVLVGTALAFYREHSDQRAELRADVGVDRIRTGGFPRDSGADRLFG